MSFFKFLLFEIFFFFIFIFQIRSNEVNLSSIIVNSLKEQNFNLSLSETDNYFLDTTFQYMENFSLYGNSSQVLIVVSSTLTNNCFCTFNNNNEIVFEKINFYMNHSENQKNSVFCFFNARNILFNVIFFYITSLKIFYKKCSFQISLQQEN